MKHTNAGFSIPEVLVASFILIWVILSSLQLTSSSILGMGKSKRRGLVDTAIAAQIEKLRNDAFSYLCTQGCTDNELTKNLEFDLTALKPLCNTNNLGQGLLNALPAADKPASFTVKLLGLSAAGSALSSPLPRLLALQRGFSVVRSNSRVLVSSLSVQPCVQR